MSSSIALCISVSESTHLLKDGTVLRVCADCNLREVLREVGYGDRLDDVIGAVTTATSSKQDAELDDEVQLHAEFGRRYVYFRLRCHSETESTFSQQ